MIYKMIYECEKCGQEFRDEEECREHEKNHIGIDKFAVKEVKEIFSPSDNYPREVSLLMEDGTRRLYVHFQIAITNLTKKESPLKED